MATLGYNATPGYGSFSQISTTTEVAVQATTPAGGIYVTQLSAYFQYYTGLNTYAWLCIWNSSGTLLYSVAVKISQSFGTWHSASVNDFFIAGGQTIYIGFAVPSGNGFTAPYDTTGTSYWGVQASPPGNTTFSGTGFGNVGAYLTYITSLPSATPKQLQVYDGTNLRTISFFAYDGTTLRASTLYVYDGAILRQVE
jgi:hypothetical protein